MELGTSTVRISAAPSGGHGEADTRSLLKSLWSTSPPAEAAPLRPAEMITALSIVYQAERQDKANNILASLALIAAGLAYLGIAALLLGEAKLPGGPISGGRHGCLAAHIKSRQEHFSKSHRQPY
jgi:hypothetical protein